MDSIEIDDKSFILIELGEAFYLAKQYERAIEAYLNAKKITKDESKLFFGVYLGLARSYRDIGNLHEAKKFFKRVYEYSPSGKNGLDYLRVLKKIGDESQVEKFFNRFKNDAAANFGCSPDNKWISLEYIGSALHIMGRHDKALCVLDKATESDNGKFAGLFESAKILIEIGR